MSLSALLGLLAVLGAASARAGEVADHPDLPPLQAVTRAMAAYPQVQAARARVRMEQANERKLQAGSYEYSARLSEQQRTVRIDPQQRLNEWGIELDRPLRLPGKAALDDKIGAQGVSQAELAYGDAMHEAGRTLLRLWFDWARADSRARQWETQVTTLKQQSAIVDKRVKAGDAPRLEALMAQAAVAQAEVSLQQANLQRRMAANDLTQRFPFIPLPTRPILGVPAPLQHGLPYWRDAILKDNHELRLAQGQVRHWQLVAARAQADRTPDPTVGLHYSSERGGEERVLGVSVSIPLPGAARAAGADSARARADEAVDMEAALASRINADIANLYANADAAYGTWRKAREVASGMAKNADLMGRAYTLGEANLSDLLTARRQANEAELAVTLAQLDAAEGHYRLQLDAHRLWPLDTDEGQAGHPGK
jgi:outer membrane protein TolC